MPRLPKERVMQGPALVSKRILAFIIDIFLLEFVVYFPFKSVMSSIIPKSNFSDMLGYVENNPAVVNNINMVLFMIGILSLIYFIYMEYKLRTNNWNDDYENLCCASSKETRNNIMAINS